MSEYLPLFAKLRNHRGMVGAEAYDALVAFFMGFDLGNEGGLLVGFQQWMTARADGGSNSHWGALALELAFPEQAQTHTDLSALAASSEQAAETACMKLFDLFEAYHRERAERGLTHIFLDYHEWQKKQDGYGPSSPHWRKPPGTGSG